MDDLHPPIADDDLHRWVDGRLDAAGRARIDTAMRADPAIAATLRAWRAQRDALGGLGQAWLDEPMPDALRGRAGGEAPPAARRSRFGPAMPAAAARAAAIALAAAGLGFVLGRAVPPAPGARDAPDVGAARTVAATAPPGFVRAALSAHTVYVPEVRHPVEVAGAERGHLVAWLSKRLGTPVVAPDLAALGFELVGGRLLPGEHGPNAQFMYQDAQGGRVTLYLAQRDGDATEGTAFRFERTGALQTFYWIDRGLGYVLSGELPRERLSALATAVHRSLDATGR